VNAQKIYKIFGTNALHCKFMECVISYTQVAPNAQKMMVFAISMRSACKYIACVWMKNKHGPLI
jgi:hypothetical protein